MAAQPADHGLGWSHSGRALPVMKQVQEEARRRKVDLVVLPTGEAIGVLTGTTKDTNAVLHVTC